MPTTSDEVKQLIRAMWLDKKSSREIAIAIKSTRSAVMGHVRRLGLTGLGGSDRQPDQLRRPRKMPEVPAPPIQAHAPPPRPASTAVFGDTVSWMATSHWHCRALIHYERGTHPSEWRVCACPRLDERPYCRAHLLAYKMPLHAPGRVSAGNFTRR